MAHIAEALGMADVAQDLFDLAWRLGVPTSLARQGMAAQDVERACAIALTTPYPNSCPLQREPMLQLLRNAYTGARPGSA